MKKLFGTDGIRGVANVFPMVPSFMVKVGQAVAATIDVDKKGIVVGKDPRLSSDMLEAALIAGITSVGSRCYQAGTLPTPAIAYITRKLGAAAGLVISASHNPMQDNGLKIFGSDGFKLTDQQEIAIEECLALDKDNFPSPTGSQIGRVVMVKKAWQEYLDDLKGQFIDLDLSGMEIVLDCANGATSHIVPFLFQELGAHVHPIHFKPDGININHHCGAMHPEVLAREVRSRGAVAGFSFDGDGDRVMGADEQGNILTGDNILLILANDLKDKGKLPHQLIVTTVMSNLGFFKAAEKLGIRVNQTQVGDRYVLEEMLKSSAVLGGEDSGHIIFLDEEHTTGDGIFIALKMLEVISKESGPVSALGAMLHRYPQVLTSVPVQSMVDLADIPQIRQVIKESEEELGDQGRVLVRYSGTQLLIRVMVEGPDQGITQMIADRITKVIQQQLTGDENP